MEDKHIVHKSLLIKDKSSVTLDGVKNIESFEETYVSLATESGKVIVEGNELKIESLIKDTGSILIVGKISGVYYSDIKSEKNGLFSKWFK